VDSISPTSDKSKLESLALSTCLCLSVILKILATFVRQLEAFIVRRKTFIYKGFQKSL
jgi:hypothetical protein